ncbi:FAD-linked oxidase [Alicyclobacillus cellulosilyticus]|uniref:FAD-linked oxidase n=1 Tax=Alicyclobacillus cellulosilyticus TaxID=1003997 RepID=A0A917KJY2_9BACL|nr:FAD-binding oxidoreductase [Alicyclobacillus cellulosilyticus]GGJ12762.1 FAD-linked oxidase [Alicyclobacillus cellulosilyticus]
MKTEWLSKLKQVLPGETVFTDTHSRMKFSRDYFHFSPVLERELSSCVADCIVRPHTDAELDMVLSIAAEYEVPITVRGSGTGNYGQSVPMCGGIVLDMSSLDQILGIENGIMVARAGARMGRMERFARRHGWELRVYPSTFRTATIGGFVAGGSGGIGSIKWGTVWDGWVRKLKVKTVESQPRTVLVEGDEVIPYIHNYGTSGVVSELHIALAPKVEWEQWAIAFSDFILALRFGLALAHDEALPKRLVSIHEWPIPSYFSPIRLPRDRAVCLLEVGTEGAERLLKYVNEFRGDIALHIGPEAYHRGTGLSDFTWNHTTLWARKQDPNMTYLQAQFSIQTWENQIQILKSEFPDLLMHIELMKSQDVLTVSGLPLLPYKDDVHLDAVIQRCESIGVFIANPHTWRLEYGGRSPEKKKLLEVKRMNDPFGLLNPLKLNIEENAEQAV